MEQSTHADEIILFFNIMIVLIKISTGFDISFKYKKYSD